MLCFWFIGCYNLLLVWCQDDEKFLTDLFAQLTDESTDDDKRHELVPFSNSLMDFISNLTLLHIRWLCFMEFLYVSHQVSFLKEFCAFSQTLQPQNRDAFFKTLSNMGILPALEVILVSGLGSIMKILKNLVIFLLYISTVVTVTFYVLEVIKLLIWTTVYDVFSLQYVCTFCTIIKQSKHFFLRYL